LGRAARDDELDGWFAPAKYARIALPLCRKPRGLVGMRIPPFNKPVRKPRIFCVANDEI